MSNQKLDTRIKTNFISLGDVISTDLIPGGLKGYTKNGVFRILLYNEATFRITIARTDEFEDFSYAAIAEPIQGEILMTKMPDHLVISTPLIDLEVGLYPVRFKFLTKSGKVINEDEPSFGTSWVNSEVTTYKKLQEGERFIGLGEKTGNLDRRGKGYVNWNTDSFAYAIESDPIYGSYPFYIGAHNDLSYGIFLDNCNKSHFNFGASNNRFASFMAEDGDMDYYFFHDRNVSKILYHYGSITGFMPLPPKWSIGYQQCRYSYYPDTKVETIARNFREKAIPIDAIVLDIHYMDKYKIFTWDREKFPDPERLISNLKQMDVEVVLMCDPGIKIDEDYQVFESGKHADVFLKYPDNEEYAGEVWPGWCNFPDFTNPITREWWLDQLKSYAVLGVKGYWNDMNEIATWGQMMPENICFEFDGNGAMTKKGRNVYGFQMARSTYEGAKQQLNGERPFNLTRAGFSGIQRYSAVWTGDNFASDEHMLLGVRLVNSLGLSGVAFAGYDIGGFVGDTSSDLFARWIAIGALSPFFRGHTMINSRDAEPWAFGEQVEEIARNYINLRYRLLPYIYSLFYEASQSGLPVARSLAVDYTHVDQVYQEDFQNQYLFGPSILVCPASSQQKYCKVFFPDGNWYNMFTGELFAGDQEIIVDADLERLPVFVKSGAILPMQQTIQSTSDRSRSELFIHLYHGGEGQFVYYEDDGKSFDFQNSGYYRRKLNFDTNKRQFIMSQAEGKFESQFATIQLILHGFDELQELTINEEPMQLVGASHQFLQAITRFDPLGDFYNAPVESIQTVSFPNSPLEMVIQF